MVFWWRVVATLLIAGVSTFPAVGMNLLANPGFESRSADQPDRWDFFVQPKPGAVARLDNTAHTGEYSVWLHTPTAYEKEPVNNWSQNIIADFGGQTLRVSGFIRVAEAKEAALWLQCWRKSPWGVLGADSTSIDMPVYGTAEWQEVTMDVDVPEGTNFVTLRCVLLGTGSAWFDDISVSRVDANVAEEDTADGADATVTETEEVAPPETKATLETAETAETVTNVVVVGKETPVSAEDAVRQEAVVMPVMDKIEIEVRRLREANLLLTDTLEKIQEVNQGLVNEMLAVQAELRALKEEEGHAAAPTLKGKSPRVPPLIPLSEAQGASAP